LADCDVEWGLQLSRLDRPGDLQALQYLLEDKRVRLVFIDPLYICLTSGCRPVSPSNLYVVGPLLWGVARSCLDAGTTPFLLHHSTKTATKRTTGSDASLELDDLAFAGIAEFARQWTLIYRLDSYTPGSG
jgi:hypothetical protein